MIHARASYMPANYMHADVPQFSVPKTDIKS